MFLREVGFDGGSESLNPFFYDILGFMTEGDAQAILAVD
jgi:hypothetical protein